MWITCIYIYIILYLSYFHAIYIWIYIDWLIDWRVQNQALIIIFLDAVIKWLPSMFCFNSMKKLQLQFISLLRSSHLPITKPNCLKKLPKVNIHVPRYCAEENNTFMNSAVSNEHPPPQCNPGLRKMFTVMVHLVYIVYCQIFYRCIQPVSWMPCLQSNQEWQV